MSESRGAAVRALRPTPTPRLGITLEPDERAWSAKEAAAFLSISTKTLYRLPIPCVIVGRRTRRYLRSTILRYMEEYAVAPI
jgi:hypothetical protein